MKTNTVDVDHFIQDQADFGVQIAVQPHRLCYSMLGHLSQNINKPASVYGGE
jgi:hypothetical protein